MQFYANEEELICWRSHWTKRVVQEWVVARQMGGGEALIPPWRYD